MVSTASPGPTPHAPRRTHAVWAVLLDRADVIADSITLTLFEQDPRWYDRVDADLRADVRASTRRHIRRGLRTLAGLAAPGEEAKHVWRETGRRRARQGVPMEMVLGSYTLGTRVLWEALLEHRGHPGIDDTDLLQAGQGVWHALDVQNAIFIEAYRQEESRLTRQDHRRREQVLDGLLDGRAADPAVAADAREVLALEPDQALLCVVARGEGAVLPLRRLEERLEAAGADSYWHVHHGRAVGLVPLGEGAGAEEAVRTVLRAAATGPVGTARAGAGLAGFAAAHQLAVRVVESLPLAEPLVADVTEQLPELLVAGSPEVSARLVETALGGLLAVPEPSRGVLLETLDALLRHDNSPKHAATRLICHRNTVLYRREQVERLSGRSLADPRDRLLLTLALIRLRSAVPATPPGRSTGQSLGPPAT